MIAQYGARLTTAAFLIFLTLAAGCIRRTTVNQQPAMSPDDALRAIFRKQTVGAFNPLTDDQRVRTLQARLKLDPQDVPARLELAGIYESYGLCEDAVDQYSQLLRLARQPVGDRAVQGLSRCARGSGRVRETIPLLEAYSTEWPSADSLNELGFLYDALGDFASAENALREGVGRSPESDRLHNNLGHNLLLQGKVDGAESEFRRALELNPKSVTAHNNLGVVLARRGDLAGALAQFQFAADAPTAHNNLAVVLLETGQYERSREQLVKALTLRRYFAPALANFKLVLERIRERAELRQTSPGLSAGQAPPAHLALGEGPESKAPEDR